jgi:cysteine desulfurase
MFAPVYLDHNATTPLDPRVLEAMLPYLSERYGNASSRHEYGRAARMAIDEARGRVAAAVGAHPTEIIFTSGGSEANNLFLKGAGGALKPGLVAVSAVEHPSVREPARTLTKQGWRFREIAVDHEGRLDGEAYARVLSEQPRLVSVMLANNETGVLQDIPALAERAKSANGAKSETRAWFHSDAVQALGKMPVDFRALNAAGVHALSVSAHKINGPKGAGALVLDKRVEVDAQISGGGQERGLRSGTENVAAIVGFGLACEIALERLAEGAARLAALRAQLERGLNQLGATIFGQEARRLANTSYFALPDIDGETLVAKLDRAGFAAASGSACSSASPEPSHVLRAMGIAPELAGGAVRVSLGLGNNEHQVADFLAALSETTGQLRRLTALAG